MFDKETYIYRRRELLCNLASEKGLALFLGNVDSPAQYRDNAYKWRQDSTWLYYFGIDQPRFAAIIDLESGDETIFADDYDVNDIIWTGPMPSVSELAERVGVKKTAPYNALSEAIKGRKVHFLPASRYYNAWMLSSLLGIDIPSTFSQGKSPSPKASEAFIRAVISQRIVKSEAEIALLDKACDLGYEMHSIARDGIRLGRIEQEIVGEMEAIALSKGWGTSFATILTQHGEVFHNHSHDCAIEDGRLLVIDAGVESNEHYASDFTRTYPTGGRFTSKQKDIYQIVYACNEHVYYTTYPSLRYYDCHLSVSRIILNGLSSLGLVKGDTEEMLMDGIAGLFMPHGLGHNIGLDVHDMEDLGENLVGYDDDQKRSSQLGLGSLRMARRLRPGHVISNEPGIYFIPALIEKWKAEGKGKGCINYDKLKDYYDFGGIRLEDDLLVTDLGVRRLGARRLPIRAEDIEEAMAK